MVETEAVRREDTETVERVAEMDLGRGNQEVKRGQVPKIALRRLLVVVQSNNNTMGKDHHVALPTLVAIINHNRLPKDITILPKNHRHAIAAIVADSLRHNNNILLPLLHSPAENNAAQPTTKVVEGKN